MTDPKIGPDPWNDPIPASFYYVHEIQELVREARESNDWGTSPPRS